MKITRSKKNISASTEWTNGWSQRRNRWGQTEYVYSCPKGTAYVTYFDFDEEDPNAELSNVYCPRVKLRGKEGFVKTETVYKDLMDAMDWAENVLFGGYEDDITSATAVAAHRNIHLGKDSIDWMVGLHWVSDWHDFTITEVDNSLGICLVKEEWIAEDVGTDCENTEVYRILTDDNGHLYISNKKYPQYSKFYANSALNYRDLVPKELDELDFLDDDDDDNDAEYDYEEDDYTPSATRGDYSPSNPWDAPGMSIHDFI